MLPTELILAFLGSNNTKLAIFLVIAYVGSRILEKFVTGWIAHRTEQEGHGRRTADQLREEIRDLRDTQIKELKDRLDEAEAEADKWRLEAKEWHNKYVLTVSQAEQQKNIIADLEGKVDHLQDELAKLVNGSNEAG
jgi:uncharacterized protein YhaN